MFSDRKKAFTLIEMLVVVVIIGIILAIVISSASSLLNNRSKRIYKTHVSLVETAIKTYVDKYKGQLINDSSSCFNINYNSLISEGLLKENDIKCTGNIIVTKGINNNFSNSLYITCVDQNGDSVNISENVPSECKNFNGSK